MLKCLLTLTFLFSLSIVAQATVLDTSNIEIKASGRVRGELHNNADFTNSTEDKNNFVGSRFRVNLNFKANDKTNIFTEFQYSKLWGDPSANLQNDPSSIHQAYIKHSLFENFDLKIGKQELVYGDELIIGAVGWSNIGRSFDALKARFKHGAGWTDLFIADITRNTSGIPSNDHYFSGLYAHFNFEMIDELEFYILHTQDPTVNINEVFHYGSRIRSHYKDFNYRAEIIVQSEVSASQWDVDAGYTIFNTHMLLGLFSVSKDYLQLFPTAHKWLGIADLVSRRNIQGARAGLKQQFSDKFKASLSYHIFERTDSDQPYYAFNGNPKTTSGTEKHIGDELDLEFSYQIDRNFSLAIGGGHLFTGKHLEENNKTSDADFYYLQTKVDF